MTFSEIYTNLCFYDKRNPSFYESIDDNFRPRVNCACDNCFYGRDKLAMEILSLLQAITNNQNHYR